MSGPASLPQLQAWLQLRELRLRSLHGKLELTRRRRDEAVRSCQQQQAECGRLRDQREALRAWLAAQGARLGPAGLALTLSHDRLLAEKIERAADGLIDRERLQLQAEQALVQARTQWLQALRQQQAARRWLEDWQRREVSANADRAEEEGAESRRPGWSGGLGDAGTVESLPW